MAWTGTASATEPFECQAPAHPRADVITRLDNEGVAQLVDEVVVVERGETVCITGAVGADGMLRSIQLVERDLGQRPLILLRLENRGSRLHVRSRASQPLRYNATMLHGALKLATSIDTDPVLPNAWGTEPLTEPHTMLLSRFVLRPLPSQPPPVQSKRWLLGDRHFMLAISVFGGVRGMVLSDFNRSRSQQGLPGLSTNVPQLSAVFEVQAARLRLGLDMSGGGGSTRLNEIGPTVSFDFVQHQTVAAFVSTGYLFGDVVVDTGSTSWSEFDSRLRNANEVPDGVHRSYGALPVEVGGEVRMKLGRLFETTNLGMIAQYRIGYLFQVSEGEWETNSGRQIGGGPSLSTGGPRMRLGFGLAVMD